MKYTISLASAIAGAFLVSVSGGNGLIIIGGLLLIGGVLPLAKEADNG